PDEQVFYGVLLALAQPFIAVGILLTMARLHSAGLPRALVLLFFVPLVNFVLFLLLSLLPAPPEDAPGRLPEPEEGGERHRAWELPGRREGYYPQRWSRLRALHANLTRDTALGSAAVSLTLCVPAALGAVFLGTSVLQNYGWSLFVGGPFALGFTSVLLFG